MIRIQKIQEMLSRLVGWDNTLEGANSIEQELIESESGLTFQGAHPTLTLDIIEASMPDDWGKQYADWVTTKNYLIGDIVRGLVGDYWIAISDNTNVEPVEGNDWRRYNVLSSYLQKVTNNGIAQVVQRFLREKTIASESKELLESRTLFDGAGRITDSKRFTGKLVGYEFLVKRAIGVTAKIERIGLQMKGATGVVKVYLFHSSQVDPISVVELNVTKSNGSYQWFDVKDMYLPYTSETNNTGGVYYLCYNSDDLPFGMEGVNIGRDFAQGGCSSCGTSNEAFLAITKYLGVSAFQTRASTTFEEFPELWNIESNIYTSNQNYGLNVKLSVGCDLTDFIVSQRSLFASALQLQVASTLIRQFAINPNAKVNRFISTLGKNDLLYEIDGDSQGRKAGIGWELEKTFNALSINTKGIDRECTTCRNGGVRFTSMG